MTMLLLFIGCALFGVAAYNLTCAFADIPTGKTSKMMLLTRKQQGVKAEKLLDVYITRIAGYLKRFVHLDKLKRDKLFTVLNIAGIALRSEERRVGKEC